MKDVKGINKWIVSVLMLLVALVILVCGIFPLVPGGGLFWTSYYLIAGQTQAALSSGFMAVKVCAAIALGIIVVEEAFKFFPRHHK